MVDCEQSLFFFRFSKGSARARERWAATTLDARNEGGSPRRKKRDSSHSQTQWNMRWPHNAKYDWLMREALTTNCKQSNPLTSWWWLKHCRNVCHVFRKKKIRLRSKEKHQKVSSLRVRDVIAQFKYSKPLFTVKERFSSKTVVLL